MIGFGKAITGAKASAMQKARNYIKETAKDEKEKLVKSFESQGVPIPSVPKELPKFDLLPPIQEVSPEEKEQIESQSQNRLAQIEAELARMRGQRQELNQEYQKRQTQIMNPEQVPGREPPRREIIIPQSKPKGPSGAKRATQAKQGSREVGKQKST